MIKLHRPATGTEVEPQQGACSRASWTGQLVLGPINVPVKAYPAVIAPTKSPLHQIHADCGRQIQYRKTCPDHGEVSADRIAKAFRVAPDQDILLTEEELTGLHPSDNKRIEIEHLLLSDRLDPVLLGGRTYHLVAAHRAALRIYALIVELLVRTCACGIARMVLSDHQQLVAIGARDGRLLMHLLHWPDQLRSCPPSLEQNDGKVSREEVQRLNQLVAPLCKPFVWQDYRDDAEQRLAGLIQKKLGMQPLVRPKVILARKNRRRVTSSTGRSLGRRRKAA